MAPFCICRISDPATITGGYGLVHNCFLPALLLILMLILPGCVSAQAIAGQPGAGQSPSIIEIPLSISLDRLFELAEQEMPLQAGNWRGWKKTYGVDTQYRAWRGALQFTMQGEVLSVQAHVRYWIRAHKKLLGTLDLESSCGVDEPPRQAIIGVQIRLGWGPDWMLRPAFRVLPTRFLDRCEMTIADIDVTPIIEREFQQQLENRMRAALFGLAPRLHAIRQQAEQDWSLLQEPLQLWTEQWLLLNPRNVALSPLTGSGNRLGAKLAVVMAPEVVAGSRPVHALRPLPPLERFFPRSPGLNLQLSVELDYTDLSRVVTGLLAGESIDISGNQARIAAIEIGGQGQEIRVNVKLGGSAAGEVALRANLVFIAESQQFELQNLDYTYKAKDPLIEADANFLRGYIRKLLTDAANQQLQQRMDQWKKRLQALLDRIAPDDVTLDMASLQLHQVALDMTTEAVRLNGQVSGRIMLEFQRE